MLHCKPRTQYGSTHMNKPVGHSDGLARTAFIAVLVSCHAALAWGVVRLFTGHLNGTLFIGFLTGYFLRLFGVTVVLHRMVTHRTIFPPNWTKRAFYVWGCIPLQGQPCWWAGLHQQHHAYPDDEGDPHPPGLKGFWYAHVGWLFSQRTPEEYQRIAQVKAEQPEMAGGDVLYLFCALLPFVISAFWGVEMILWGNLIPIALGSHITWSVNSVLHMIGLKSPKFTGDNSRNLVFAVLALPHFAHPLLDWLGKIVVVAINSVVFATNLLIGIIYGGENLHAGHHAWQRSARFGSRWWEPDPGFWAVLLLQRLGLVTLVAKSTVRAA